jgi:hypothetical protein
VSIIALLFFVHFGGQGLVMTVHYLPLIVDGAFIHGVEVMMNVLLSISLGSICNGCGAFIHFWEQYVMSVLDLSLIMLVLLIHFGGRCL